MSEVTPNQQEYNVREHTKRIQSGAGNTTFKVSPDGVFMGGTTYTDAKWKVTYAGVMTADSAVLTNVTATGTVNATAGKIGSATNYWSISANGITATSASADVIINYGKTDFTNVQTGFILGYDYSASKAKFYIGSATEYFNWDGTSLVMAGTINATGGTFTGTISGGSFIGGTYKTVEPGAATAGAVVIEGGSDKMIKLYYNTTVTGWVRGWNETVSGETEGMRIGNDDVHFKFRQTNIAITGHLLANADNTYHIGDTDHVFTEVWGKKIIAKGTGACFSISGSDGVSGTFTSSVTVVGGIVTGGS